MPPPAESTPGAGREDAASRQHFDALGRIPLPPAAPAPPTSIAPAQPGFPLPPVTLPPLNGQPGHPHPHPPPRSHIQHHVYAPPPQPQSGFSQLRPDLPAFQHFSPSPFHHPHAHHLGTPGVQHTSSPPAGSTLPPLLGQHAQESPSPLAGEKAGGGGKRKGSAGGGEDGEGRKGPKRQRTTRSCDPCRSRKIRCDFVPESNPPICSHCQQYGITCTSNLPISETRFKKRQSAPPSGGSGGDGSSQTSPAAVGGVAPSPGGSEHSQGTGTGTPRPEARMLGPTSISFLVHSQATLPSSGGLQNFDTKHNQTWEVGESGNGFIRVQLADPSTTATTIKPMPGHLERPLVESLVNAYFAKVAPIFPVITKSEFLASPSPLLLRACCAVAANGSEFPQSTLDAARGALSQALTGDVLSRTSLSTVQALLILSLNPDGHDNAVSSSGSMLWVRSGIAIRMAQDLGLHREPPTTDNEQEAARRRRIWGAAVVADRWLASAYGLPLSISLTDCDVLLPSPWSTSPADSQDSSESVDAPTKHRPFAFMTEMVKLSVLAGRVLQTIYSAAGLRLVTDAHLVGLLAEIDQWKEDVPPDLKFVGRESNAQAGILHLAHSCLMLLFFRVFMRISFEVPQHLTFSLSVVRWTAIFQTSKESIEWVEANPGVLDHFFLVSYCLCACALIQYHTWTRRRDDDALDMLRRVSDIFARWRGPEAGELTSRAKLSEVVILLYKTACGLKDGAIVANMPGLNPTVGVKARQNQSEQLRFMTDPSRPGGGVFVSHERRPDLQDLPPGLVLEVSGSTSSLRSTTNAPADAATGGPSAPPAAPTSADAPSAAAAPADSLSYAALATGGASADLPALAAAPNVDPRLLPVADNVPAAFDPVQFASIVDDSTPRFAFFDWGAWGPLEQLGLDFGSGGQAGGES